jgi:hypothetical protein
MAEISVSLAVIGRSGGKTSTADFTDDADKKVPKEPLHVILKYAEGSSRLACR